MRLADRIQRRVQVGEPIEAGGLEIRPESTAWTFDLPKFHAVWNRPTAVLVEGSEGEQRLPVANVTRLASGTLLGLALLFGGISMWLMAREGSGSNGRE